MFFIDSDNLAGRAGLFLIMGIELANRMDLPVEQDRRIWGRGYKAGTRRHTFRARVSLCADARGYYSRLATWQLLQ